MVLLLHLLVLVALLLPTIAVLKETLEPQTDCRLHPPHEAEEGEVGEEGEGGEGAGAADPKEGAAVAADRRLPLQTQGLLMPLDLHEVLTHTHTHIYCCVYVMCAYVYV